MNTRQETLEKNVMLADLLLYKNGRWEGDEQAAAVLLEEKEKALKELNHIEEAKTGYTVYAVTYHHSCVQRFIYLYRRFETKAEAEEFLAEVKEQHIKDREFPEKWRTETDKPDEYAADLWEYRQYIHLGILEDIEVPSYLAGWDWESANLRVDYPEDIALDAEKRREH